MCEILKSEILIGIDMEYTMAKSTCGGLEIFSLIQIACYKRIFLVDCLSLNDLVSEYLRPILTNNSTLKLIFSGAGDIKILINQYQIKLVNFIDLAIYS